MADDDEQDGLRADDEAETRDTHDVSGSRPAGFSRAPEEDRSATTRVAAGEPAHGPVRYTRRRVIILGGAVAAGVAATVVGLRSFGGSIADKVGGLITVEAGTFPINTVENVPDVPAEQWVLRVDGLVDTPLTIDRTAWNDLHHITETADFHCVEGWGVDDVRWGGVAPAVLLDRAGVKPEGKYAVFHAHGGVYWSALPLELVLDTKTLLADALAGRPLPPKHGGPLRLVVPKQLGYKSVKWVVRIEITEHTVLGYWERRGYPDDAPVPG